MPQFLHRSSFVNWFRRVFTGGVNTDVRPEVLKDGLYSDALNMRPASVDGNTGAIETIRGEEILYPVDVLVTDPTSYVNIGSRFTNGHIVEFWASSTFDPGTGANPPYIRVDGVITAMSANIPYIFNRPLQIAVVEECGDKQGILFPADQHSDLLFWDVKAMLDALAAGSQLYFAAYTTDANSVALNAPPSIVYPAYPDCLVDLGGPVGLPVGQYAYFLRYVDPNGNRTNWGPACGLIPVPAVATPNNVSPAPNYPRTVGGDANLIVPSQYGIVIEFRVNNPFGYTSLEIGRQAFNDGAGIQGVGVKEVIARLTLTFGQNNIVTFTDPVDTNINPHTVIPADEAVQQFLYPREVKAIDYADRRLKIANYKLDPRDIVLTFLDFGGKKMTAITKALKRLVGNGIYVPDGYDNPYNCAVFKSAQRGGQAKYGIQFWDGGYGLYPVVNIPEPFTAGTDIFPFPQRRDIKGVNGNWGADSTTYSDDPCYAATVDVASQTAEGPVGSTFEVFTGGEQTKQDTERLVNVAKPNLLAVGRDSQRFSQYATSIPPQVTEVNPPFPDGPTTIPNNNGYQPWDPRNNQAETSGFNIPPNTSRFMQSAASGGAYPTDQYDPNYQAHPADFLAQCYPLNPENNKGRCFNPTHHALGALLAGVDSGIPQSAGIMSVVYNGDTRGEIVAQGFGSWDLRSNPTVSDPDSISDFEPATKDSYSLRCYFPDQAAGIIDQALWDDIQQNPGNYQVRFVSPVPFYPEIYGYKGTRVPVLGAIWAGPCVMANLMDIMCHTSFLHDEGQVNVGVTNPAGYQPIPGNAPDGSWVGFDKWRRSDPMDGTFDLLSNSYSWWQQEAAGNPSLFGQGGNALFDLSGFVERTTGRTTYYELTTPPPQAIYPPASYTAGIQTNVNGTQVRNTQGPWYVLNIVRVGATIPNDNIEPYKNMGCHIALKQSIGLYQGGAQDFRLIGEREYLDCTNYLPTDYRYTYLQTPANGIRRWLCATGNTQINTAQILIAIINFGSWQAPDGLPVYGLYEHVFVNGTQHALRFGGNFPPPPVGSRIMVKYDKTAPIRIFGHDVTVAPVTHAVRDASATSVPENLNDLDILGGLPFIHAGFGMNPRWFLPETDTVTEANIYINYMASIRQWCIMWSAESRVLPSMYVNNNSTPTLIADRQQYFPAIHYVARPMDGLDTNGFFNQYYAQDYFFEASIFSYGGLRYLPAVNLDYARQPDVGFFGYPKVGIVLPNDFCTNIAASLEFDPAQIDSPGYRTFLQANVKTLSNESGEIKVIATATYPGASGQNQYVWFESAVGRVLTAKNILTGASGEQISTYVTSNYWGDELRLSRNIGLPDQLWRLWAKGYATTGEGYMDTFFWPDRRGWYRMRGDSIEDISRNRQLKKLLPILQALPAGYTPQMSAFYNTKYQEMWASISPYTSDNVAKPPVLVVYSPQTNEWLGEYSYRFDQFLNTNEGVVAMRLSETWSLDEGFIISGDVREAWVEVPVVGEVGKYKEMVRWRVVGDKPDEMTLIDADGTTMSIQSAAIQEAFKPGTGFLWAKLYDSYEGWWWRVMASYDPARRLPQDVRFFVKVKYNTAADKQVTALENQLKNIR